MHNDLETKLSLVLSKYENIKDSTELLYLLNKEFNTKYNEEDLLNYYLCVTDLEIENNKIDYGYFPEYTEFNFE
jgi:hypothetical protein